MKSTLKEELINLIRNLPEEATIDDILYHLFVKKKISEGVEELNQGKGIPHEEVMKEAKLILSKLIQTEDR